MKGDVMYREKKLTVTAIEQTNDSVDFRSQIELLEGKVDEFKEKIKTLTTKNETLTATKQQLIAKLGQAKILNTDLKSRCGRYEEIISNKDELIEQLKSSNLQQQQLIHSLKSMSIAFDESDDGDVAAELQQSAMSAKLIRCNEIIEMRKVHAEFQQKEIAQLNNENEDLRNKLTTLSKVVAEFQNRLKSQSALLGNTNLREDSDDSDDSDDNSEETMIEQILTKAEGLKALLDTSMKQVASLEEGKSDRDTIINIIRQENAQRALQQEDDKARIKSLQAKLAEKQVSTKWPHTSASRDDAASLHSLLTLFDTEKKLSAAGADGSSHTKI